MSERVLRGTPAAPGVALGAAAVVDVVGDAAEGAVPAAERADEATRAEAALERAAGEVEAVADRLRAEGRADEAEIVATGALMARDPGLASAASATITERGLRAGPAILEAADAAAAAIAAIDDPTLAARAADVRSVARRAARLASAGGAAPAGSGAVAESGTVLVAADLGPADVADLDPGVAGVVLARGGATAHAAIVARSLGLPMVVGAGNAVLGVSPGVTVAMDGDDGTVVVDPGPERLAVAERALARAARQQAAAEAARGLPAETRDGHRVRLLVNAAFPADVTAGLRDGAEGVGLLRTELAALESTDWPTEEEHRRTLAPILAPLEHRIATVRVLDFGADKTPPFLAGTTNRGTALLLDHPDAFRAQLRAIVAAGARTELRILLPLVDDADQLEAAIAHLEALTDERPQIGAMVETPTAAGNADELAARADFLSIGTNDLIHAALGTDRFGTSPADAVAHHPHVVANIAATAQAAQHHGVPLEVCGEAASDPRALPLLVGLGIDELSVGAARVGIVRAWIRALDRTNAAQIAQQAIKLDSPQAVEALLGQALDTGDEGGDGLLGIGPVAGH